MTEKDGYEIAMSIDPNVSDDVCTFCRHAEWPAKDLADALITAPKCRLGHTPYFRSLSNMGPIWVSDCQAGELRPELAAVDKNKGATA